MLYYFFARLKTSCCLITSVLMTRCCNHGVQLCTVEDHRSEEIFHTADVGLCCLMCWCAVLCLIACNICWGSRMSQQVVKVIWHQTALPPQIDGSVVFARWCQCAVPYGHIGAIWRIRLNLCFLWPFWVHNPKRQIDWFSRFCTAYGRMLLYFTMGDPFPKNFPFSWGIWTPI